MGQTNLEKIQIMKACFMGLGYIGLPTAIIAAESSAEGKSIFSYDKTSKVATAYLNLAKEVISNGEKECNRSDVQVR